MTGHLYTAAFVTLTAITTGLPLGTWTRLHTPDPLRAATRRLTRKAP